MDWQKAVISVLVISLLLGMVGCSGGGPTTNSDSNFTEAEKELDITLIGCGQVTREPKRKRYEMGTEVTIIAQPKEDFKGWGGNIENDANEKSLVMDSDYQIIANFYSKFGFKSRNNLYTINDNGSNLNKLVELNPRLQINGLHYLKEEKEIIFLGTEFNQEIQAAQYDQELYTLDIYSEVNKQLTKTASNFNFTSVDWEFNRRQLLVTEGKSDSPATYEIYRFGMLDGNKVQLTTNDRLEKEAIWGPKGERIAFTAVSNQENYHPYAPEQGGNLDLYLMTPQGKKKRKILDTEESHIQNITWLQGGKILFKAQKSSNKSQWWLVNTDGSNKVSLQNYLELKKSLVSVIPFSKRQKLILATKKADKHDFSYFIVELPSKRKVKLAVSLHDPEFQWGPQNKKILVEENREKAENKLYIIEASSGEVSRVIIGHSAAWVETGQEFIFLRATQKQPTEIFYKYNLITNQAEKLNKKFKAVSNLQLLN